MTMKDWALKYAELGLAVFPLLPKEKRPATRNGCKDATTNKQQVIKWWDKCPEYNIGIAAGPPSGGLVVIDLDVSEKGDGRKSMAAWQQENGELPGTWTSTTGRGGRHLLYRDRETHRNKVNLYKGIDVRGDGGYIVVPPSVHPNGGRYEWQKGPGDCEIAQADSQVEMFLLGPMPEERQSFALPNVIPEGERTNALVRLVGSLKAKGLDNVSIKAAVRGENAAKCVPPLTEQELEKTVFPAVPRWVTTNPYTAGTSRQKRNVQYTDADTLMLTDLPPVISLVEGLLTLGLGGLSAKSKLGKSWLALQLSVDVACGDKFLGFTTRKSGVLYIDLENTPSLTQGRLRSILDGREPPKNLYFAHDFNLMGEGFEEDITEFIESHPDVKLVVIDVFQKVKRGKNPNQSDYEADYEILTTLKRFADEHEICIMPIYHDRKLVDPTDPFSNLLGSTAIIGVSDFVWVLHKEKREAEEATLAITGRTLIDARFKLSRDGVKWKNLGNAAAVEAARKRREYDQDPVVNTIKCLLRQNNGTWRGRTGEIIESSQLFKGCRIYGTPQKVGAQIKNRLEDMQEYDHIIHYKVENGSGSSEHVFEIDDLLLN